MLTQEEKRLILTYSRQIRMAYLTRSAVGVKQEDLKKLAAAYIREVEPGYTFRPWCSRCGIHVLSGLHRFLDQP